MPILSVLQSEPGGMDDSPVGSNKLAAELRTKADLAETLAFPMNKRDDLRIAALEKYAAERSKG